MPRLRNNDGSDPSAPEAAISAWGRWMGRALAFTLVACLIALSLIGTTVVAYEAARYMGLI